ncbi:Retrovirus-related Pol poly from transposon TNT 1-94 [Paramuricea clavata]|uniref:Retrovirus-related Pol poly from transposon TNT 1-94 n=1 Tax=Paramuricea clavata TaxID=317549 RepID=A0A6S7IAX6_PARCT|nr:Retrovirus-related Pol poly from transposon TNT 1-94 [Paramuricea clavata]
MATATNPTGYGPRRGLLFNGDESKYELWEVKFLAQMRLQKLHDVFVPGDKEPDASRNGDAFAELVQCLDDRSLALVIREAKDDGQRALEILRQHYQGKSKPRVISLYTELTTLKKTDSESIVDYVIRAETAATALRNADEAVSDALLIAMVLKGLPSNFKAFSAIVIQRDTQMTFAEFKVALRSYEESEKSRNGNSETGENIMAMKNGERFDGVCFKCGKKGHKKSECWSKSGKNGNGKRCSRCRNKTHDTKECRSNRGRNDSAKKAEDQGRTKTENSEHTFTFKVSDSSACGKSYSNNLLVDTGATSHIVNDKSKFIIFDEDFDPNAHIIELADGSKAKVVTGKGVAKVKLYDVNGSSHDLILNNALYVPSYQQDIFSVNAAIEEGASISLDKHNKSFKSSDGAVFNIEQVGRLYYLNGISSSKNNAGTILEWHRILGHCNFSDIRKLENVVDGMKITSHKEVECKTCTQGKMTQSRNRTPDKRTNAPFDLVHSDLAGPISPGVEATKQFLADIAPLGKVKCIRSDNGGEFIGQKFKSLLRENTIKHETCAPYSPHQNGTAERAWLSLFNMARCLLLEAKLPKMLWTYAVMASAYIRNRCFNDRLGKTPYEALTGIKPNLNNMHVFGAVCYAYVQGSKKLGPRSKEGIFVGYDKNSPAYLVYYPESMKVERVRCVKFFDSTEFDNENRQIDEEVVSLPRNTSYGEQQTGADENIEPAIPPVEGEVSSVRHPTRTHNKPAYLSEYVVESITDSSANVAIDYCYRMNDIPACYSQAVNSSDSARWKKAMDEEFDSLVSNETFTLTMVPPNREIVGGKWVYKIKSGPNDEETYKARYVAKGYSQVPGVDYHETFAPTARMSSIRVLMQHAVQNDMIVHQMDVKAAYLNAPIDCDIFVEQPKGYEKVVGKVRNSRQLRCPLVKPNISHWLKLCKKVSNKVLINADNQGAIKLAKNPAFHKRSKHIDIKYHFIRSEAQQGAISLRYIAGEDNLADIFTKPVSKVRMDKFKHFICN